MDNVLPISSMNSSAAHRNSFCMPGGSNFAAAAAALASVAAASQQHLINAAMRAAAASTMQSTTEMNMDHGESGASNSPLSNPLECTAESKLIDYRQEKVAAFEIDGETMICLPQAYELFLKNLVGGLHTVYTKLKRLAINPYVCNVEQVRALRSIGAIQPGVNRCKLISCSDFDVLYEDCASSSSRPGRPPKRSPVCISSTTSVHSTNILQPGASLASGNNVFTVGGPNGSNNFGLGGVSFTADGSSAAKRPRFGQPTSGSFMEKFNTAMNPMTGFMNNASSTGASSLNPSQLFPLFPFVPQNLMLSQFVNMNPNAALLAKHWGDQLNNSSVANDLDNATPIDATIKTGGAQLSQQIEKNSENASNLNRDDRNVSWSSMSGRESDEFLKFSAGTGANGDDSANVSNLRDISIMVNGNVGRHQSEHRETKDENVENDSDLDEDDDTSIHRSSVDDLERKNTDKDDDYDQHRWTNASSSNGGTEASQLLRSMADIGANGPFPGNSHTSIPSTISQQHDRQRSVSTSENVQNETLHYSSVENILFSVLGLVQVAASTARMHEEQLVKEKLEAIKLYEAERKERIRLEKILRVEKHSKAVYLKRLRKERNHKAQVSAKMVTQESGSGKNVTVQNSSQDANQAKKSSMANGVSKNLREISPLLYPPGTTAGFTSMHFGPEMGDNHRRNSSDSQQESASGNHLFPRLTIDVNASSEFCDESINRNGDIVENCSDTIAKNSRGRTATLYVKNEHS